MYLSTLSKFTANSDYLIQVINDLLGHTVKVFTEYQKRYQKNSGPCH